MVGDAEDRVTSAHQFPVPPTVALEGDGGAVEIATVGLDDEAVVGPEEVNLDPAIGDLDGCVEERRREVALYDQRQDLCLERALELAARL